MGGVKANQPNEVLRNLLPLTMETALRRVVEDLPGLPKAPYS